MNFRCRFVSSIERFLRVCSVCFAVSFVARKRPIAIQMKQGRFSYNRKGLASLLYLGCNNWLYPLPSIAIQFVAPRIMLQLFAVCNVKLFWVTAVLLYMLSTKRACLQ